MSSSSDDDFLIKPSRVSTSARIGRTESHKMNRTISQKRRKVNPWLKSDSDSDGNIHLSARTISGSKLPKFPISHKKKKKEGIWGDSSSDDGYESETIKAGESAPVRVEEEDNRGGKVEVESGSDSEISEVEGGSDSEISELERKEPIAKNQGEKSKVQKRTAAKGKGKKNKEKKKTASILDPITVENESTDLKTPAPVKSDALLEKVREIKRAMTQSPQAAVKQGWNMMKGWMSGYDPAKSMQQLQNTLKSPTTTGQLGSAQRNLASAFKAAEKSPISANMFPDASASAKKPFAAQKINMQESSKASLSEKILAEQKEESNVLGEKTIKQLELDNKAAKEKIDAIQAASKKKEAIEIKKVKAAPIKARAAVKAAVFRDRLGQQMFGSKELQEEKELETKIRDNEIRIAKERAKVEARNLDHGIQTATDIDGSSPAQAVAAPVAHEGNMGRTVADFFSTEPLKEHMKNVAPIVNVERPLIPMDEWKLGSRYMEERYRMVRYIMESIGKMAELTEGDKSAISNQVTRYVDKVYADEYREYKDAYEAEELVGKRTRQHKTDYVERRAARRARRAAMAKRAAKSSGGGMDGAKEDVEESEPEAEFEPDIAALKEDAIAEVKQTRAQEMTAKNVNPVQIQFKISSIKHADIPELIDLTRKLSSSEENISIASAVTILNRLADVVEAQGRALPDGRQIIPGIAIRKTGEFSFSGRNGSYKTIGTRIQAVIKSLREKLEEQKKVYKEEATKKALSIAESVKANGRSWRAKGKSSWRAKE